MANDRRLTTNDLLLYYITDRTTFAEDESTRHHRLLEKIREAARAGVDYIQLREKNLPTRELESLAREAVAVLNELRTENRELRTALLLNSRTDIALAVAADGVHLRSEDITPTEIKQIWAECGAGAPPRETLQQAPLLGISCHSPTEVAQAAATDVTFAVFAPVFEKKDCPDTQPTGLNQLREACKAQIPVLALGGITLENAKKCLEAGAAGIAAIRLFQENDVSEIVKRIRGR
jgi:thiamine-phosphate pyrophosphorylase